MNEIPKHDISMVVGQTIGEIRALHLRLDQIERDLLSATARFNNRPSRAERYLLIFTLVLLGLLAASSFVLYRSWIGGRIPF
jgi:hypothetical protein